MKNYGSKSLEILVFCLQKVTKQWCDVTKLDYGVTALFGNLFKDKHHHIKRLRWPTIELFKALFFWMLEMKYLSDWFSIYLKVLLQLRILLQLHSVVLLLLRLAWVGVYTSDNTKTKIFFSNSKIIWRLFEWIV